jgi:hypothetical protein
MAHTESPFWDDPGKNPAIGDVIFPRPSGGKRSPAPLDLDAGLKKRPTHVNQIASLYVY